MYQLSNSKANNFFPTQSIHHHSLKSLARWWTKRGGDSEGFL